MIFLIIFLYKILNIIIYMNYHDLNPNLSFVSDTHLEHYKKIPNFQTIITPNPNNILLLLGDIGNPFQTIYDKFIQWCSQNFQTVIFITGNHEYYGSNFELTNERVRKICNQYGAIFLNNEVFIYKNYAIIGTTLWSYVPKDKENFVSSVMNDYNFIQDFSVQKNNMLFQKNVIFLNEMIQKYKGKYKIIVLSHHTPLTSGTSAPHLETQPQNCAFSSDLGNLVEQTNMWFYGHTHYNLKNNTLIYKNVPLYSNQRGYPPKTVKNYNINMTIEI
jgi:predicted phosphohydrolase